MITIFSEPILNLPEADVPIKDINARLSQDKNHQIIFMEFDEDVDLSEHSHESQWGVVLEGKIDLIINGIKNYRRDCPPIIFYIRRIRRNLIYFSNIIE